MPEKDHYRSALNRSAALTRVAREGGAAVSEPARRAFLDKFIDQVDPERTLSEVERQARAQAARRAYFVKLAAKSAQARRTKADRQAAKAQAAQLRELADDIESAGAA